MYMNRITLRHLRYAESLARHRHFGRAAAECAVTQPALSMQIAELERIVGLQLFERARRQVTPTAIGAQFVTRARTVLAGVDEIEMVCRAANDPFGGTLRIGVIPTVAPYLLPSVMNEIGNAHAHLRLSVRESVTSSLIAELGQGRIDTAIVALPVAEPGITEFPLFTEPFVLIRPAADAGAPVPSPRQLREMRLLLLEDGHCFRDQALTYCRMSGDAPREVLDASTLTTLVQMVAAGMGVTLIPQMAVRVETMLADVDVAEFTAHVPTRTIGMLWRTSSPMQPHFRALGELLRQIPEQRVPVSSAE